MRKAIFPLLVLAWVTTAPLWGQTAESSSKGRELLDRAIQALGGDAFLKVKTAKFGGRVYAFSRGSLSGLAKVVEYVRYPHQRREEYGKEPDTIEIFNGDGGWTIDIHGAKPFSAEELRRYREQELMDGFHILRYRLEEPDSWVEYAGRDFVGNRAAEVVNFTDRENRTAAFSLDAQTYLPLRVLWLRRDPETRGRIEETELLSNYFTAQGITAPRHLLRQRDGNRIFEAFIQETSYNLDLPDSLFVPPK